MSLRFKLIRVEDESGVSGTGHVADGVQFENQICVLNWKTNPSSTAVYSNIIDLQIIHGHNGKTRIEWVD